MDISTQFQPPIAQTPMAQTSTGQNPATAAPQLHIPEKFLDPDTKEIRLEALLKSYLELEKKLAAPKSPDTATTADDQGNLLTAPEENTAYNIRIHHEMFTQDDEIDAVLQAHGFTNSQAQTVYDLAAEKMVPLVLEIAREFEAERQLDRLITAFGSKERYQEIARQLLAFGQKTLPQDVLDGLASSYEGVMALYRMMQSGKPMAAQNDPLTQQENIMDESALRSMMRDPKYWRDKDEAFIKKVSDGFRQVFAERP